LGLGIDLAGIRAPFRPIAAFHSAEEFTTAGSVVGA
jgi:hypothetical protein